MRQVRLMRRCSIAGLFLSLAVTPFVPNIGAETGPTKPSQGMPQLSQAKTIAICSEEDCDCGPSPLVSNEVAPCTVTSTGGG